MDNTSSTLTELHQIAWVRMFRASRSILEAVEEELKRHKLPPLSWYDLLLELKRAGKKGLRPSSLQSAMLIPQYNMSRLLTRVEDKQLISRSKSVEDARAQVVVITADGRKLLRKMWPVYRSVLETKLGTRLDKFEAEKLATILEPLL